MEQHVEVKNKETENEAAVENKMSKSGESSNPKTERRVTEETEARWSRLKLFDKVMQKSLEKYMEHVSFNRFASTFRPLYKKNPQRMESIYKHFIKELRGAIQEDISRLIEEGRLESKLNELDKLESSAKNNTDPAWRPSGVPAQDFCSFLMPYYQKQKKYLRLELKKIQVENAALAQKILAGRESISQTEHRISAAVDEWKASVTEFEKTASSVCTADLLDM